MFATFKSADDGSEILINSDHVAVIRENSDKTEIVLTTLPSSFFVEESVAEVSSKLRQAKIAGSFGY